MSAGGLKVAEAAAWLLAEHDGDLASAVGRLSHLDATKAELWDAVAYLAIQGETYRKRVQHQEAPRLAIMQIESIIRAHREAERHHAQGQTSVGEGFD